MRNTTPLFFLVLFLLGMSFALAGAGDDTAEVYFATSDRCMACHNRLTAPSGLDVSIGTDWRGSMMANSARDPYWQAAVTREVVDHPTVQAEIEAECSRCHMPMSNFRSQSFGEHPEVFAHLPIAQAEGRLDILAADGVSCTVCHQIQEEKLGTEESFVGHFVIDTETPWGEREIFGPYEALAGLTRIMQSASRFEQRKAEHIQSAELCATCHTLYTSSYQDGEPIARLPEQVPYLEWRHSGYPGRKSCQDCHLPVSESPAAITSVLGREQEGFSRHVFRGGNFFMSRLLNRHGAELGVEALPGELEATASRTIENLQTLTASLELEAGILPDGLLAADLKVTNLAGHKLPSAYPSRRAWVHFVVRDAAGSVVFESGALRDSGYIEGNANDEDPSAFEPHHTVITRPDQVQIYEGILAGPEDEVTTGLLTGVRYIKDNRILPMGFEKETAAEDFAVQGEAYVDPDFTAGSDQVRFEVDLSGAGGPYRIEASIWFQPISFRWAQNLKPYDAAPVRRFVRYYEGASGSTAQELARIALDVSGQDTQPSVEPAGSDEPATSDQPPTSE